MTHDHRTPRTGLTALAAVIALSSTPLLAQTAPQAIPAESAPVPVASAPVLPAQAAPAAAQTDPAASAAGTSTVAAAPDQASAPAVAADAAPAPSETMATRSTPVEHVAHDDLASSTPVATPSGARPVVHLRQPAVTHTLAPPAAAPTAAPAASRRVAPVPVSDQTDALSGTRALTAPAPSNAGGAVPSARGLSDRETAEIGGGAALLLLLGGGAYAFSRRRRGDEAPIAADEAIAPEPMAVEPAPAVAEPVRRTRRPMAQPAGGDLPDGFDLSRFGPHVQAAYRGPSPDNPSLSLKKRLHRAAALDQRDRLMAERGEQLVHRPAPARRGLFRPAWVRRSDS